jgi:hypothetical protein
LNGACPQSKVAPREPKAFQGTHHFVVGREDQAVFVIHAELASDWSFLGIAPIAQQQAMAPSVITRDQSKHGLVFMGLSGTVPGHGTAPANPTASNDSADVLVIAFGDFGKALIAFEQFFHNDEGRPGFSATVEQVVLAALRHPTTAAQAEKTEGVWDLEGHRRNSSALMMAVCWCWLGAAATLCRGDEVIEAEL